MKRKLLTLLVLLMTAATGAWADEPVTYALQTNDTFTSGQTVEVKNAANDVVATITYGETGGADFIAAKTDTHVSGFTAFTEGNGVNGNKEGGTFYTITPKVNATITVAVVLNKEKAFYIEEDGTALAGYSGITVSDKYYGTYEFDASANKAYKVYCAGSKLGFYGFKMTNITAPDAPAPTYTVSMKEGTEDAEKWTIEPNPAQAGQTVTATYGGALKVKSVRAKKAAPANVPVESITLNKTATEITVGQTETLSVTEVLPAEATDKTYTWKSSDETKATVDQDGKVTAKAAGTVNIYAEANDGSGVKGTCAVTVKNAAPSLLSLTIGHATIYYVSGETWREAIANHSSENAGWRIGSGGNTVIYDDDYYLFDYSADNFVSPDTEITSGDYGWPD